MSGRRKVTCAPMVVGTTVALVRGSFTEAEVEAYTAEAREFARAQRASSDPPATVPGSTATPTLGDTAMTHSLDDIETAPPTGGDKFVNADHEGELLVLTVKGTGKDTFDNGEAEFIIADITLVEGTDAGESFDEAWLFGRVLFGQLKRKVGRTFVGRIVKGQAQKGKSAPWQLDPVSDEDRARAVAFMRERTTPPPVSAPAGTSEGPAPTDVGDVPPWER